MINCYRFSRPNQRNSFVFNFVSKNVSKRKKDKKMFNSIKINKIKKSYKTYKTNKLISKKKFVFVK